MKTYQETLDMVAEQYRNYQLGGGQEGIIQYTDTALIAKIYEVRHEKVVNDLIESER